MENIAKSLIQNKEDSDEDYTTSISTWVPQEII